MSLPSLQELLHVEAVEEQLYEWSFEEAKSHPAFVLHTSGSTGI
jgi:acyl-coenzyme A synthetase/AMP-(fatty) acid ligase